MTPTIDPLRSNKFLTKHRRRNLLVGVAIFLLAALSGCSQKITVSAVEINRTSTYPSQSYPWQLPAPRPETDDLLRIRFSASADIGALAENLNIPFVGYALFDCEAPQTYRHVGDVFPVIGATNQYDAFVPRRLSALHARSEDRSSTIGWPMSSVVRDGICFSVGGSSVSGRSVGSNTLRIDSARFLE